MYNHDAIIIGAGPAGMLAAGRAAELGANVLILEKMQKPGQKLLITGKGRCNITNSSPISEFIKHIHPDGRFLKNAFSRYFSKDIIQLLTQYNVDITLERGGRYFPTGNKSVEVLNAILKWLKDLKVQIYYEHRVEKILVKDNSICGLISKGQKYFTKKIILATGGKSYPATGSTGDGYELAKQIGHSIVRTRPSLVPLETKENYASLQNLTLKNVKAIVWIDGKKVKENFGEMTFTEFGISGPIILTLSRLVVDALNNKNEVEISLDLKPALDEQKLDKRLQRELNEHGKKKLSSIFRSLLPSQLIPVFINKLGITTDIECNQVNADSRKKIRNLLKNYRFKITNHRSFKEAIITAGGIPTSEISPKTMESKIISGLYFAGEIIDLDAETGGYNLQIAYSTGWLAGQSCTLQIAK